jgi:hypothetical protein
MFDGENVPERSKKIKRDLINKIEVSLERVQTELFSIATM